MDQSYQVINCPQGLNIRDGPAASANLMGTLSNGTTVSGHEVNNGFLHHEKGWSLMSANGKTFLQPASAYNMGGMSAALPVISGGGASGASQQVYLVQNCPVGLNVRDQPSSAGNKTGSPLANGSHVVAIQVQGDWLQHQTGWSLMQSGGSVFLAPVSSGSSFSAPSSSPSASVYPTPTPVSAPASGGMSVASHAQEAFTVVNVPSGLNVRDAPSATANKVGAPLAQGSVVVVSEKNGNWYKHASGWSIASDGHTQFLVPYHAGAATVSSPAPVAATPAFSYTPQQQPVASYPAQQQPVASYPAQQQPVSAPSMAAETYTVINAPNGLNVRNGPGTNFTLVGSPLATGSTIVVTEKQGFWVHHQQGWSLSNDGSKQFLQQAMVGGMSGGGAIVSQPSFYQQPPVATQTIYHQPTQTSFYPQQVVAAGGQIGVTYMVQNCPNGLNVRNQPFVGAAKVATLQNGATFVAQQVQGEWIFNGLGWSMMRDGNKQFLVPMGGGMQMAPQQPQFVPQQQQFVPQQQQPMQFAPQQPQMAMGGGMEVKSAGQPHQVQNCPNGLNVRSQPNTTSNLVGTPLPNGTIVTVFNRNGVWFQHQQGWSMSTSGVTTFLVPVLTQQPQMAVTPAPVSAIPEGAKQELHTVVNANKGLNVRNGPGTEYQLVGAPLANGSQVVVVGAKGNWAQHLSGWSLSHDDHGTVFLQPVASAGGAAAPADGAGAEGQPQSEGVVACEFCHAPFKSEDDVFCSKCGKSKSKPADVPPAFNPNFS